MTQKPNKSSYTFTLTMPSEEKPSKGTLMVECAICGKNISDRRNLNRHLRNIHRIEPKVREPKLNCCYNQECTFVTSTYRLLREHLKDTHDFIVEKRELSFSSREGKFRKNKL